MANETGPSTTVRVVRGIAVAVAFTAVVVLLMLWLAGVFTPKVGVQGATLAQTTAVAGPPVGDRDVVAVRRIMVPREESAVGTVRAVHETAVASKLLAKVEAVNVTAGQRVAQGDVLVRLDDNDLEARLEQAQASAESAEARLDQARIEYERITQLYEQGSAAKIELDRVTNEYKSAKAELEQARQAVREAETVLEYATIRSPIEGVVIDKRVETGDTVSPGQVLLTLYDPDRMQLVARVRETLTRRLEVGQSIDVKIEALDKRCQGNVSEIVPEAETASRTFTVKVTGPCPPGVYSGMFGRLFIPLDEEPVLVIPQAAVRRVGQLTVVDVVRDDRLHRRAVQLGRDLNGDVVVLSGLQEGERVAVPFQDDAAPTGS